MAELDDFESVRQDTDRLRRARRATALLTAYQQRATELARIRRSAIEEAHRIDGLSYTEIAAEVGISKGRVTQIRSSAPGPERVFFGVGPVSVGVPLRRGDDHRMRTYIDAADLRAQEDAEGMLTTLSFAVERFSIEADRQTMPAGDAVIICGPRSAPVARTLLADDVKLGFEKDGRWSITDRVAGSRYYSPRAADPQNRADYGYCARHKFEDRVVWHVAGITAIGSAGVLHYLKPNVRDLFDQLGDVSFSLVVRCSFADDETTVLESELVAGPYVW